MIKDELTKALRALDAAAEFNGLVDEPDLFMEVIRARGAVARVLKEMEGHVSDEEHLW